jgi:alpha-L-rhamnosidase
MFGGGLTWFYRNLAGMQVDPENPGYKHIIFKPQPVKELSFVKYYNQTIYGNAGIYWQQSSGTFNTDITVPVGCTATVYIPADDQQSVTESGNPPENSEFIEFERVTETGYAVYRVKSGRYHFKSTWQI